MPAFTKIVSPSLALDIAALMALKSAPPAAFTVNVAATTDEVSAKTIRSIAAAEARSFMVSGEKANRLRIAAASCHKLFHHTGAIAVSLSLDSNALQQGEPHVGERCVFGLHKVLA